MMSSELIKVTVQNDQQLVSARELHKGLGIKRRFSAWWEQNSAEFEENIDFQPVLISTPRENRGSIELQDYALTIDMAKQHNCTLKAELDILDFDASILSREYRLPIATMVKELRKYEA